MRGMSCFGCVGVKITLATLPLFVRGNITPAYPPISRHSLSVTNHKYNYYHHHMISHHRHRHGHHESSPIDYNTTTTTTTTTTTSTTSLRSSKLGTGDTHVTSHPTRLCHGGPNRYTNCTR